MQGSFWTRWATFTAPRPQAALQDMGLSMTLSPSGAETILHVFSGGADGATPYSGVSLDSAGNLYGTTYAGGNGFGVVYKLTPAGEETILYRFTGSADGAYPNAGVILDSTGNLYGTTTQGGFGYGVVYELSPLGEESVIYTFNGTESDPIRRAGSSSIRKGIYSGPLRRAEVAEAGWSLSCVRQRSESPSILIGAA